MPEIIRVMDNVYILEVCCIVDKDGFIISQANCIDSTAEPTKVFAGEVNKLKLENFKPQEQLTLEPYERDHAIVVGVYR